MARLRDPEGGCPWDIEQDFASIVPYTIEEAYEVADAIAKGDMAELREELGDLLLQSVYHAQMAAENGDFTFEDVVKGVTAKMIHRHPHVFGEADAANAADVNAIWDQQKSKEKNGGTDKHLLDSVPTAFPALLRAEKLQKKAAKVGFEWPDIGGVLDKLKEEIAEMREAIAGNSREDQLDEYGDLLFVMVNYGRMMGLSAEDALRRCNDKFTRRFNGMEDNIKKSGKELSDLTLDQLEQEWLKQKQKEVK